MIGFMVFCAVLVVGIITASWVDELIQNRYNNSWPKRVTAEDLEELGRLLKK